MTTKRATEFDLGEAVQDPGFTPRRRDAEALLDMLASGGPLADAAAQSLLRLGALALPATIARVAREPAPPVLRLLGRIGSALPDEAVSAALIAALAHADERVVRAAANALAKVPSAGAEEALAAALARTDAAPTRRALIESLGRVGGTRARAIVADEDARQDPEVTRERVRAGLMLDRSAARAHGSSIDASVPASEPVRVALRCRDGLEPILREELAGSLRGEALRGTLGPHVACTLAGAPEALFAARTWYALGFPLPPVRAQGDLGAAIVASLTSPASLAILRRWTRGPIRFRLAFASGGKRRAVVWRVAEEVQRKVPELLNDPTESPWEALVHEARGEVVVELVPQLVDPRFAYRTGDVPAASHPTIAAALVRVGGARAEDSVWDPFVGSGTELCERAIAGPYRALVGSDLDERALAIARANLTACGVREATLLGGDASRMRPPGLAPDLIVTNPPLGRRVQRTAQLAPLLDRFVAHAARVLAPGGRMAWISPFPDRSREVAKASGLSLTRALEVDLGGFVAEMQVFAARGTVG
jgi:predicted RNA methylase